MEPSLVLYEQDFHQIAGLCERLLQEAQARAVLLIDKSGQYITSHGDVQHLDTTSLASLTAGTMAATHGLAQLVGEETFPSVFHEGKHFSLYLATIAQRAILLVIFDRRSNLGLVRLRTRRVGEELAQVFDRVRQKAQIEPQAPLGVISDEDIDNLFNE